MASPITVDIEGRYNDRDINRAMGDLRKLQSQGMTVGGKMQAVGDKMQAVGAGMARAGRGLTAGVTLPIVGIGTAAVFAGADFEKSMNKVRAVSGVAGKDFEDLKDTAKELGRTTQFSASEAADGMTFLAMAGFKTNEIIKAMPATLNLAAVGELALADAADIASNVLGGFRMSAEQTNRVVDVMAKVSASANTSVAQMGEAMSYAGPVASAAGISIENAAAFIGRLGDAGIQGSRAGTTLVGIIGKLENQTPKAAKRLKELGVVTHDASGSMLPLEVIVAQLGKTSITAGDYLSIFGQRAGPGMAAVVGMGVDGLVDLEAKAKDAGGAAQTMADTQLEGLRGQLIKLRSAFEGVLISIAESGLLDVATKLFERLTDAASSLAKRISELTPQQQQMILKLAGIAAAAGPVLMIVGKLLMVAGGLIKMFGAITVAGTILAAKFIAIGAVIAIFVAAIIYAWRTSEPFRNAIQNLWATLQSLVNMIKTQVIQTLNNMGGSAKGVGGILETLGKFLSGALTVAVNGITAAVKFLGGAFQVALKVVEVAVTIFRMVANVIKGILMAAFDILMNKLGPVSTALRAIATGAKNAFTSIATIVRSAFNNAGKFIEGFINFAIKAINALISAYNKLATVLPGMSEIADIQAFKFQQLAGATGEVASANSRIVDGMGAYYQGLRDQVSVTEDASDSMSDLQSMLDQLNGTQDENTDKTKKNTDAKEKNAKALEKYKEKFNEVVNALKAARERIESDYKAMFDSVQKAIVGSLDLKGALPETAENGETVGQTFIEKLQAQAERAVEFANRIRTLIASGLSRDAIQMVLAAGVEAGNQIADELIRGGQETIDATNTLIESTQQAANDIGFEAAEHFYGAGLALAKQTEAAFNKRFGKGGPGYGKLNQLMNHLAKSMERTTTITVVTRHVPEGLPGRRMGGPVAAGSPYIVGESGMELFVPQRDGVVIPNHDLRGSMTGRGGAITGGRAGTTINLTVNAGIGTQGDEVGRQIVEAIRAYERRSGRAFVAA